MIGRGAWLRLWYVWAPATLIVVANVVWLAGMRGAVLGRGPLLAGQALHGPPRPIGQVAGAHQFLGPRGRVGLAGHPGGLQRACFQHASAQGVDHSRPADPGTGRRRIPTP